MKNMLKKLMSAALVCCLLTGSVPLDAYASEAEQTPTVAAEEPAKEEPKKEEPKKEEPKKEEPKKEEPKKEEPKKEEPKKEEPAKEEPKKEEPKQEAPATEAPATEAPATEAPATEAPATEAPATEAPATEAPATEAPATEIPATEVPVTEAPATEVPATEVPTTEAPATEVSTEKPGPAAVAGIGYIEDSVFYITEEDAVIREMPSAAPCKKIVICEEAGADFGDLEIEIPVIIEKKGMLAGGIFLEEVENNGVIEKGEFREKVKNGSRGLILGGKFEKEIGRIDPKDVDFKTQFIYGKTIYDRKVAADWTPECSISESEIRFDDEGIYEFGICADADASAPASTGVKFTGLAAETAYAVFARFEIIDGDWTRLDSPVITAAVPADEDEQEEDAQDEPVQDEPEQDEPVQDEPAQDEPAQEGAASEAQAAPASAFSLKSIRPMKEEAAGAELTAEEIAAANVKLEQTGAYKVKLSWAEGYEVRLEGGGEAVLADAEGWFHTSTNESYRAYARKSSAEGENQGAWTDTGLEARPYYIHVRVVPETPVEGETIRAVADTNLPEDEPLLYDWHAVGALVDTMQDVHLLQSGMDSSYTAAAADVGWDIRVTAYWEKDGSVFDAASARSVSAREMPAAPELSFDYEKEEFTLTMQAESRGDFQPAVENKTNGDFVQYVPESAVTVYTYPLSLFEMAGGENTFTAMLTDSTGRSVQGGSITLARPELTQEEIAAANVQVQGQIASCAQGYELRAVDEGGNIFAMIGGQFSNLVSGESYTLQLRRKGSNEEKRLGSAWTALEESITAVVPMLVPAICSAPDISAMIADTKPGDTLYAVIYSMEEGYTLPADAEIFWHRADDSGRDALLASGSSYTASDEDEGCRLYLSITSAQEGWTITANGGGAVIVRREEISFSVDYEAETITAVLNREGDWNSMLAAASRNAYASGSKQITAALNELLSNAQATAEEIICTFTAADGGEVVRAAFTPKARPAFDGDSVSVSADSVTAAAAQLSCSDAAYQPGLMDAMGAYAWADESGLVIGLEPGGSYTVVLRKKGSNADGCFASEAGAANAASGGLMIVTPNALHARISILERDGEGSPAGYALTIGGESEAGNVSCSWYAVDMAGNETLLAETGNAAELILTEDQKALLFFKRVKALVKDNAGGETTEAICSEYHAGGISCRLDYEREALLVSAPAAPATDCVLHIFGKSFVWPAGAPAVELALGHGNLPGNAALEISGKLVEENAGVESTAFNCTVPARPAVDAGMVEISVSGANVNLSGIPDGLRVGLAQSGREIKQALSIESGKASGVIDDLGKPCYVLAQIPADNANQNFESNITTLKVIPAAFGFALKRQAPGKDAQALKYGTAADLGDKLVIELKGEDENVAYRWLRSGVEIPGETGPVYQTVSEDMDCVITVELTQRTQSGENTAAASAHVSGISFGMTPNYADETLTFAAPCALSGGWFLRVSGRRVNWQEGAASQTYALEELGISIEGGAVDFSLLCGNAADASLGFEQFSLPGRTEYAGADAVIRERRNTSIEVEEMPGVEFGMSPAGAAAPSALLGSGPVFEDLLPGVPYQLWMRNAATDSAFAGKWKAAGGTVTTALQVSAGKIDVRFDYAAEEALITAPDTIPTEDLKNWSYRFDAIKGNFHEGERTRRVALAAGSLYNLISDTQDRQVPAYILKETDGGSDASEAVLVTIPKRPEFNGSVAEANVKLIGQTANSLAFSCAEGYEIVLKGANGFIYSDGDNRFTGLDSGYRHEVYLRNPATDAAFASVTKAMNAVASTLKFSLTVDKDSVAVGGTITANLDTGGASYPDLVYTWYVYGVEGMEVVAEGPNSKSYTPRPDDLGCTLIVEVTSESAKLQNWIVAGRVVAAVRPTPTMPAASDVPKATPTPTATVSPTPTSGFITDWGSYYDDFDDYADDYDFYGEPEADGQGYESSQRLYDDYLGSDHGISSIVLDEADEPMDYELLPIYWENGENANTAMVVAQPDDEGEVAPRKLRIYLKQLDYLYHERDISSILFRNGDADARLSIEELLTGDSAKLAAHMLQSDAVSVDLLDLDLDSLDEAALNAYQLSEVYLEIRIAPVPLEQERTAWEISAWMYTDGGTECDVSNLLYDFTVCLNVHGMFEEEEKDTFTETNAIALMDMEDEEGEEILLDGELVIMPDERPENMADEAEYFSVMMPVEEWEDVEVYYEAAIDLDFYRNYALETYYAGPGAYLLAELEDEEAGEDYEDYGDYGEYDEYDAYDEYDEYGEYDSYDEYDAYEYENAYYKQEEFDGFIDFALWDE